jgi:hypothetical protein
MFSRRFKMGSNEVGNLQSRNEEVGETSSRNRADAIGALFRRLRAAD